MLTAELSPIPPPMKINGKSHFKASLRGFAPEDWYAFPSCQRDPRCLHSYPWPDRTDDYAKNLAQVFINQQKEVPRRMFQQAIALKEIGVLIGNCGIRRTEQNDGEAEIGYELAPDSWGQGFATEAANAIAKFGFRKLRLHRISS